MNAKKLATHHAQKMDFGNAGTTNLTFGSQFSYSVADLIKDVNASGIKDTFSEDVYRNILCGILSANGPPEFSFSSQKLLLARNMYSYMWLNYYKISNTVEKSLEKVDFYLKRRLKKFHNACIVEAVKGMK